METRFLKMQKRVAKTLIKPVEFQDFWDPFWEISPKIIKKHYLEKVFATRFPNVGKPYETNGKHGFSKTKKRVAKTLIKPVEFQDFWDPFWGMAPKIIKKALPREGFCNAFLQTWKTL